jgi:FkbM family methyltransferase
MVSDPEIEREELIVKLHAASDLRRRLRRMSRIMRVATHPMKAYYPELLRIAGLSHRLAARTFWSGKMEAVIPEEVSTHIWRYGYFEEDVCIFLFRRLREGMAFLDIGAHFGFFTLLGSYLVGKRGRVLAFEPTPTTYKQLVRNVCGCSNVEAYHCAAFDRDGEVTIQDYGLQKCAWNSIGRPRDSTGLLAAERSITVQARKIDSFVGEKGYERVDLVKVDVESSELCVLRGMIEVLNTHRPDLIVEVGDFGVSGVSRSKEMVLWLQEMGYSPYEVRDGAIVKHRTKTHYGYGNLLFLAECKVASA